MMKKAQQGQGGGFTYTYGTGSPFGQQNPFGQQEQRQSNTSEGKVHVDYIPQTEEKRKGKGTETAGEFIDFEEVK